MESGSDCIDGILISIAAIATPWTEIGVTAMAEAALSWGESTISTEPRAGGRAENNRIRNE